MSVTHSRAAFLEGGQTSSPSEDAEHMQLINDLARTELEPDQVYIRSMYLCSSRVCETDWKRFSRKALEGIAEKVVGESVLAGHDKQSLPVARFFKAVVVERPEIVDAETGEPTRWVRAWFYWLKETRGAKDLALNMDGGIYREVSISWRYRGGRCSICDQPELSCVHVPGEIYDGERRYTRIDEVVDVLEGSLVYRGADRETGIMGEHGPADAAPPSLSAIERMFWFEIEPLRTAQGESS